MSGKTVEAPYVRCQGCYNDIRQVLPGGWWATKGNQRECRPGIRHLPLPKLEGFTCPHGSTEPSRCKECQ